MPFNPQRINNTFPVELLVLLASQQLTASGDDTCEECGLAACDTWALVWALVSRIWKRLISAQGTSYRGNRYITRRCDWRRKGGCIGSTPINSQAREVRKLGDVPVVETATKRHAAKVLRRLQADYPEAPCALNHETPFQLLIATILSAQCTDERVNLVTRDLFRKYKNAADFSVAPLREIEKGVQSTGFFRNKAKNIQACSRELMRTHGGEVPQDLESLVGLAGVGRKTANVVLGTAFGLASGVVVDTHVGRLSRRLGLTLATDAVKVERDLMKLLPKKEWIQFSHRMIHHGRAICSARRALCSDCSMKRFCPQVGVESKGTSK